MDTIQKTQTICPVCGRPLTAEYKKEKDGVYFISECPVHGKTMTLAAENEKDIRGWMGSPVVNVTPKRPITKGNQNECPLHCGTCENHMQTACCVLIDITNRCNQHCPYCFAESDLSEVSSGKEGEPDLAEMERKYDLLLELGEERPFNIHISGGEPTVRDDLPKIIRMGREKGFEYIQINSNGKRIAEEEDYAKTLKEAGASVVFMQFDGTRDDIYLKLRNEALFEKKKKAVENCRKAGLPVTLVPTIVKGVNLDNIGDMMKYLLDNTDVVKGIHFQPASFFGRYPGEDEKTRRATMFDVMHGIEDQAEGFCYKDFAPIATGHQLCCFYSTYMKMPDGKVKLMLSKEEKDKGVTCCGKSEEKEIACCSKKPSEYEKIDIIKKNRDYVLNKWSVAVPGAECSCKDPENMDFDDFLSYYKNNVFTVTGMAFMDRSNLDAERLKRCRVQQLTADDRLIPFCAYNSYYRDKEKKDVQTRKF